MMNFKYHHTDSGFCRVCFTAKVKKQTYYYCIQESHDYPKMYRCCKSWEPDYSITFIGEFTLELPNNIDLYAKDLIFQWKEATYKESQNE